MTTDRANRAMILTPPGPGAIGVIRVVGPRSVDLVQSLFRSQTGRSLARQTQGQLLYGRFVANGETIDDVIVCIAPDPAPRAVDICCHGGVRVLERVLEALERRGAVVQDEPPRPADIWPTANTIEHEAIEALAQCRTLRAVHFIAHQHRNLAATLRELANLYRTDPTTADETLSSLLAGYPSARTLIDGATVVIVGPPNAGKSTLFNQLAGRAAAIVSPHPGTTRDWVTETVDLAGIPVLLVDTAGLHDAVDALELEAIRRGAAAGSAANIRLLVLDGSCPLAPAAAGYLAGAWDDTRLLVAINKTDHARAWADADLPANLPSSGPTQVVEVSALTGRGLDELTRRLARSLEAPPSKWPAPSLFTSRQCRYAADILGAGRHDPDHALAQLSVMIGESPGDPHPDDD